MDVNPSILKAYINHFLPREVVGPVIIVFSLEGVIDGIFNLYVPDEFAPLGWGSYSFLPSSSSPIGGLLMTRPSKNCKTELKNNRQLMTTRLDLAD
jgi:hypothetical protein